MGLHPKYSANDFAKFIAWTERKTDSKLCTDFRDLIISLSNLLYKIDLNNRDKKLLYKTFCRNKKMLKSLNMKREEFAPAILDAVEDAINYRNSDALYEYSFSRGTFAYNNRDNYDDIEGALYNIPNDYDGEFSSEISEFKVKFEAIYTAYLLNEAKSEMPQAVGDQNDSASTFTPTHSSSSGNSSSNADEYNASDYSHTDDFYYDNYDDFYDYEEAEDYWDENG